MNWFLIALIGPLLWSIVNHLDKFLLNKYFKGGGTGSLLIFSSLIGIFMLPIFYFINPNILNVSFNNVLILLLINIPYVLYILFYLYALDKDEASIVVPLFQMIPVLGYFLGFIILGETLTFKQILASLIILSGSVALALDLEGKKIRLKLNIFLLMFVSSFLFALYGVLFKMVAIEQDFIVSSFWTYVGLGIAGLLMLGFIPLYRKQFFSVMKQNKSQVLGVNGINEVLNIIADVSTRLATLLAPLALVYVVSGFQPLFVLIIGVLLTIFLPHVSQESLLKRHLVQKVISIAIIVIGAFLLET
jgi:drug/metabolite transporter (DMT)-like permease